MWVLANLAQDEEEEYKLTKNRFDILLAFINPEGAKKIRDAEESANSLVQQSGDGDFYEAVKNLPERRVRNSGPTDDYIKMKRAGQDKSMEISSGRTSEDKPVYLERKIIVRDKNNG